MTGGGRPGAATLQRVAGAAGEGVARVSVARGSRLRSLLYGFGCWTGGIFFTLGALSLVGGMWTSGAFFALLTVTLGAGLAAAFYADGRAASRGDGPR